MLHVRPRWLRLPNAAASGRFSSGGAAHGEPAVVQLEDLWHVQTSEPQVNLHIFWTMILRVHELRETERFDRSLEAHHGEPLVAQLEDLCPDGKAPGEVGVQGLYLLQSRQGEEA